MELKMADWQPFTGTYVKDWYDVRLPDGEIITHCWPNAGEFHDVHGGTDRTWKAGECEFRPSAQHPLTHRNERRRT